ncbi:MAG: hypothetical protein ACFE95_12405 [Candidatus Hodarchaeota archaeon]
MIDKEIVNLIDPLSQFDRENFQSFEYSEIRTNTQKAVLFCGDGWEGWVPLSQLRINEKEEILVANWLYDKMFSWG